MRPRHSIRLEEFLAEREISDYRLERVSAWRSRIVFKYGQREVVVSYSGAVPGARTLPKLDLVMEELGR
jgi:hypothetical protein